MDFSSNLRTYSNVLAKIFTSQTPTRQCFYCKKKKEKKKKRERKRVRENHQMNAVGFQTC